ncbi:dynein light chain Tctex-type protein 2B-like [Physella acuta]|uniref:dynein light chain Tctex-type protein 2B-like n=1 Tax=Physella acuta TaxID=109671 RepID=UPI0027DCAFF8|nr:dynein light chain Tctex-type protein 2B-like [Physella acuta]
MSKSSLFSEKIRSDLGSSTRLKLGRFRLKMKMLTNLGASTTVSQPTPYVAYENTYKLAPDLDKRFSCHSAEEVIRGVFQHYLHGKRYDAKVFPRLIKTLTELIRDRVKMQGLDRYKILAIVTIVENKDQGVQLASRALWNHQLDNYASLTYKGPDFVAVGCVYAVYQD